MALDYNKHGDEDDFLMQIRDKNASFYPTGYTGYEQYYIDIEGFWRQLYDPDYTTSYDIVSISIATRPDCLSNETIEYLNELNQIKPVTIELGLQTIYDSTAKVINRGYNLNVFEDAVKRLNKYNIEIVVHIINGLPFETKDMMLDTVKYLNKLNIHGIKIHSLFILKNTKLAEMFLNNEFNILTMDEYVDTTVEQLAIIRDDIVIHRINGDAPRDLLIEPQWSLKKLVVMNEIDKKMKERNYYQGCKMTK
jgi:radical SAM protein (TIGR01212 family)